MRPLHTLFSAALGLGCCAQSMFNDEFNGIALDPRWIIVDPNPDSHAGLTGEGELLMRASPLNGGSDYAGFSNYNAPFILQPVCGNWTLTAKLRLHPTGDAQDVGIFLFPDSFDTHTGQRVMERRFDINCGFSNNWSFLDTVVCLAPEDTITFMHLTMTDGELTGAMSRDSITWVQHAANWGSASYRYAGLLSIRQPWNGVNSLYTNAYFDYFRFVQVDTLRIHASDDGMVCAGQDLDLAVDTMPDAVYSWQGPNGTTGNGPALHLSSLTASDSGWYSVQVSRIDCRYHSGSIHVVVDDCTDVPVRSSAHVQLSIAPNPAVDDLSVTIHSEWCGSAMVSVRDAAGRAVLAPRYFVPHADRSCTLVIPVHMLAPAAYVVQVVIDGAHAQARFIKR